MYLGMTRTFHKHVWIDPNLTPVQTYCSISLSTTLVLRTRMHTACFVILSLFGFVYFLSYFYSYFIFFSMHLCLFRSLCCTLEFLFRRSIKAYLKTIHICTFMFNPFRKETEHTFSFLVFIHISAYSPLSALAGL